MPVLPRTEALIFTYGSVTMIEVHDSFSVLDVHYCVRRGIGSAQRRPVCNHIKVKRVIPRDCHVVRERRPELCISASARAHWPMRSDLEEHKPLQVFQKVPGSG